MGYIPRAKRTSATYEQLSRYLDNALKEDNIDALLHAEGELELALQKGYMTLTKAQKGQYAVLREARKAYDAEEIDEKEFRALLKQSKKSLKRLTRRQQRGLEDTLTEPLKKIAAAFFFLMSLLYLNKANITGYTVSSATGTSLGGYYSLLGFTFLGVAVLVLLYTSRQ